MTNPVYLALDIPQIEPAKALLAKVKAHVGGVKLGLEFFCAHGAHGVHEIAHMGLPIFLDLKFHDIPNTVAAAMQAIHVYEPAIVTVHASGGRAMMEDAKAAAAEGCKVVGVTMLTSLDTGDLAKTGIYGSEETQVMRLAELAHEAGLDGIVCSGHEVARVKKAWKDGFFVVPGLRLPGSGTGDQKRVVTPRAARDAGASVLVIGRPISRAEDPEAAARAIEATL
ncbi:MAG: orotidine-5'-phosphate decarboxylase [Erythrobacter sp.]|uniref:orotidine-5'-phosphate decarboxylase n=1 Tax=Erythrobacter sp. HL-111 TaxID=1798193 RepID=UPI0006D96B8B|nr:orotidine-5'-phosphate decarboxylase [Erythrobacter sp. HL-111]KPP95036.1 MAG: orotidine 5'-phosphate decarboxylase PyrF [Erythrobacteraceae bacterium HL-111]SDS10523.1 orotidine-5'-phosphate decarboxylase [Erythrobacter sp. HL-111]